MNNPIIISAIGGAILLIFTVWSSVVQKRQSDEDQNKLLSETQKVGNLNEELRKKTEQNAVEQENKQNAIIKLQKEANIRSEYDAKRSNEFSDRIIKLQENVSQKAEELIKAGIENKELYKQLFEYQTGGNSYCYLDIAIVSDDVIKFKLVHKGKNPLYNIYFDILNVNNLRQPGGGYVVGGGVINDSKMIMNGVKMSVPQVLALHVNSLEVEQKMDIQSIKFSPDDEILFCIAFSARNQNWIQRTVLKKFYIGGSLAPEPRSYRYYWESEISKITQTDNLDNKSFPKFERRLLIPLIKYPYNSYNPVQIDWEKQDVFYYNDQLIFLNIPLSK